MDQSLSESDVSLSPSKIFERLQMLRQLQIMQRGKLQKHNFLNQDSPEISTSVTEIVSHFSNSTSYNTFSSLLQSSQEIHVEGNSCFKVDISPRKEIDSNYIEGVSALNLSQESEFITNSPVSSKSVSNKVSKMVHDQATGIITTIGKLGNTSPITLKQSQTTSKQQISLDEMPILSPKKGFEELVVEKLKSEKTTKSLKNKQNPPKTKKPFLKRGEGMARFGLQKKDLVIQNTKTLPWRKAIPSVKPINAPVESKEVVGKINKRNRPVDIEITVTKPKGISPIEHNDECDAVNIKLPPVIDEWKKKDNAQNCSSNLLENNNKPINNKPCTRTQCLSHAKHPVKTVKGQTWASVLTKEQDMFLTQLKQSDYYKNFVSPAKSTMTDTSCNGTPLKLMQDRERAEQNMFELLENKVTHDSFNLNNSFFNRFLRKNHFEYSGESTPIVLQKCLYDNPDLLHLHHEGSIRNKNISCCDGETCSVLTEDSETCSSVSTCCSCKKVDSSSIHESHAFCNDEEAKEENIGIKKDKRKEENRIKENENCRNDNVKKDDSCNADMVEMNAKLIATSELLKDRLRELEDEIETFRKENANLTKLREELDIERQKFYEEKSNFEQKYNEEKILSEYYLAEEKEKLNNQKQIYDRYIREMRGRLNKKDKEEVSNLKREITELKDEIRNKDAKSTGIIARLRNQIKIIEKDRKTLQDEIEKLKKENRRIQHSNDITRRLTNLKYLEQINKKLTHSAKYIHSENDIDGDQKYKAFEIERQTRIKKPQPISTRRRAKSVPNLNVTSRYAKYFSKKDCASDKDANDLRKKLLITNIESDTEEFRNENEDFNDSDFLNEIDSGEDNNLEKIYNERFQSFSVNNKRSNSMDTRHADKYNSNDGFFIQRTDSGSKSFDQSNRTSLSTYQSNSSGASVNTSQSPGATRDYRPYRSSKSPVNGEKLSQEYNSTIVQQNNQSVDIRSKSPVSILSNRISGNHTPATVINKKLYSDKSMIPSPEPISSGTSVSKTNLNPIEIKKPDGSRELRFPNGNVKLISSDGKYSKFVYYNGDVKENFYDEGRIKYFYAETKTYHTTHVDGLEVLEFSDGQTEKRYKDGSSEIRLPNGSVRYYDPKNEHVREEWRFPDGASLTVSANGEQRIVFTNGQVEVHAKDHKRREFPDGTVKLVYNDGTSETRYASGRVRIKDKHGNLIMDSAPG